LFAQAFSLTVTLTPAWTVFSTQETWPPSSTVVDHDWASPTAGVTLPPNDWPLRVTPSVLSRRSLQTLIVRVFTLFRMHMVYSPVPKKTTLFPEFSE
jgi:hypothetical protein